MSVSNLYDSLTAQDQALKVYGLETGAGDIKTDSGDVLAPLGTVSAENGRFTDLRVNINQTHTTTLAAIATPIVITDRKGKATVTAAGGLASGATAELTFTSALISSEDACLVSFAPGADLDASLAKLQLGVSEVSAGTLKIKVINNDAGAYTSGTFVIQFLLI